MKTILDVSSPDFKPGFVSTWEIVVAGILLSGLIILGYGFAQHIKIVSFVGLVVILAAVLNGVIQIVTRPKK